MDMSLATRPFVFLSAVTTGADGQTTLRFDDGQVMALAPNSEFRIAEYRYAREQPANDSFGSSC